MSLWSRTDTSPLSRWWWTVDRASVFAVLGLIGLGLMLILSASPPIAAKHGFEPLHFFYRQLAFLAPALGLIISLSLLPVDWIKSRAVYLLGFCYLLLLATLFFGSDTNGAKRWIAIGNFALQPSEFLKPFLVIVLARVLSDDGKIARWKRFGFVLAMMPVIIFPLVLQPDFGQTALISMVCVAMMFLAGLPFTVIMVLGVVGGVLSYFVYTHVPHVAQRIDGFLNPDASENYQVQQAVRAFQSGGPFGDGIGEGRVKWVLPDAHTDFIFAVAGEEFGLFFCLAIVALFGLIAGRAFVRAMKEPDHFIQLAASGLGMLLAMQAFINLGVNVHILPAKGMTLPFVSYGGSSLLAVSVTLGLLLALTRRRITGGLPKRVPFKRRLV